MKSVEDGLLLDFYGNLLTDKTRSTLELYLDDDLTLAEIADTENISRQGVHDTVKRGMNQLREYEEKLGLIEKFTSQMAIINEAIELIDDNDPDGAKALLEALKTEI
ncbi:MAG: YlxM family DNA-binding protein [Clostridiales bacterium]|nr:YlxM family DNA-binding protein [Clostridiales bacterium]